MTRLLAGLVRAGVRLLVRLAPEGFRREYADEFLHVHRTRMAEAVGEGLWATLGLGARELGGTFRMVMDEWRAGPERKARPEAGPPARLLDGLGQDLRFSVRMLWRHRSFAATAAVVVALGLGATTAVFSTVNAYLFRPLPFADADRLVALFETNPEFEWDDADAAPANALDWREQVEAFEDLAVYVDFASDVTWVQDQVPELLGMTSVSGNFFDLLGIRPALGRAFRPDETWAGSAPAVIVSHRLWVDRFGSDPGLVGRTIELNGESVEVVGVAPAGFAFPSADVDLWRTMRWDPGAREQTWFRRAHFVRPIARLAPGFSVDQANAQLQVVVNRLQVDYPETNRVMGAGLAPVRAFWIRDLRRPLTLLSGAAVLLLLLACVNVANLMLVRMQRRRQEVAVRYALGAGRRRVLRQLVTESVVLAALGGALGLGLGWLCVRLLHRLAPVGIEGATALALDVRVFGVAGLVALGCGVVAGLLPAFAVSGRSLRSFMGGSGRSGSPGRGSVRTTHLLVGLEVALSLAIVLGAGLMLRSFMELRAVDPGFRTTETLAVDLEIPEARYEERDVVLAFWDQLQESLRARPGVEEVGFVGRLPLEGANWSSSFKAEGWPAERVGFEILHRRADPGYFQALDIPLVAGRLSAPSDGPETPLVVVINERFAAEHFPDEDPIGQRIAYDREPGPESIWYEIIGVVGDQHQDSPAQPARAEVFENWRQDWSRQGVLVLRTTNDPTQAVPTVRAALRELDPLVPLGQVRTLDRVWRASTQDEQVLLVLLGGFGILALTLAVVGVYGVTAQAARRRTREIGIRIALGADRTSILTLVLGQAGRVVLMGVAAGLGLAALLRPALTDQLYGVGPGDPLTWVSVTLVLVGASLLASLMPARAAARTDPVRSLSAES